MGRTLLATVDIGGMDCRDSVSPATEQAVSDAFAVILQMSSDKIKGILVCKDNELKGSPPMPRPNGVAVWPLPVEERSLKVDLHIVCASSAAVLLKRPMLQHLNGGEGLLSITTKFTENLQKNNICPAEAGCEKVVVESVTPKEKSDSGAAHFVSVFGYTLSDLMRLTGRPAPTRMSGPPGSEVHYGDDTDGWLLSRNKRLTFIRAFKDEYRLQLLLRDSEKWLETERKGFEEKFDEMRREYAAALRVYKSSANYTNPVRVASGGENKDGVSDLNAAADKETEQEKKEEDEAHTMKERNNRAGDELVRLTNEFERLEPKAENLSEPFEWP